MYYMVSDLHLPNAHTGDTHPLGATMTGFSGRQRHGRSSATGTFSNLLLHEMKYRALLTSQKRGYLLIRIKCGNMAKHRSLLELLVLTSRASVNSRTVF